MLFKIEKLRALQKNEVSTTKMKKYSLHGRN